MELSVNRSVFHSRKKLLEFLMKQPQIVVTNDEDFKQITVVRLCVEDAKICGGVDRWLLVNWKFIHSVTISRDPLSKEDDFFKMICLWCDPRAIKYLEELCANPQLGISYIDDFFEAGQFLESVDRQADEADQSPDEELVTKCDDDMLSKLQSAVEAGHLPAVSELAWKTFHYENLGSLSENTSSRIQRAFQIALDGLRRGCDSCRGIVSYMLMKCPDQVLKYPLSKQIAKLLLKYHLHCIRISNKYTLFVNGIRMLSTNEARGIELIKMAADLNLEVAECWMGDYCEKQNELCTNACVLFRVCKEN